MKVTKIVVVLLFFIFLCMFLSCSEKPNIGSKDSKKEDFSKELRVGTGWDATRPGDYQPYGMWEPACLIYETLVNLNKACKPVQCLADRWEISHDGMVYTFYLHKGIKFHNGSLFDAKAVKINYIRLKKINWQALSRIIKSVKVIDRYTIRFSLVRPAPLFFFYLAGSGYGIIAPSAIKLKGTGNMPDRLSMPDKMRPSADSYVVVKAIGTGPYKWDENSYKRGRSFSVVTNSNYWQGKPVFEKITWLVIPDPSARTIALGSGEIEMTGQSPNASLTEENVIALKRNSKIKFTKANNWGTRLVIINHKRPPFDNVNVRRALRFAIDFKAIQRVFGELAVVCPGPFGPDAPYTVPDIKLSIYDPEKARCILDHEGLFDTDNDCFREYNGETIKLEILTSKSKTMALLLCEYLAKIGIKASLMPKERGAIFQVLEQMDYDIAVHPNIASFFLDLYGTFHSGGRWSIQMDNPVIDKMLDKYIAASDDERFKQLGYMIQQEIQKQQIILFAVNENKLVAYNNNLGEFIYPPEEWVGALQEIWRMK